jgi:hypothetical protein
VQVVEMKRVRDEIEPVIEFLRVHVKGSLREKGSRIEIEGATHDEVKQLLQKYFHQKGLTSHKVHSQQGLIEIVRHDHERKTRKESKGRTPTATETVPYFFPGR